MGRLAWLVVLGAGPLAASLLAAHDRAPLTAALRAAQTAHDTQSRAAEKDAVLAAWVAARCSLCGANDIAEADVASARLAESTGNLAEARDHYQRATVELTEMSSPAERMAVDLALNRIVAAQAERDRQDREAAVREAAVKDAAAREARNAPAAIEERIAQAESTLQASDARTALSMLADIDSRDGAVPPDLRERALLVDGRAAALEGDFGRANDFFAQAVTLAVDHADARWSDAPGALRVWSDTVGAHATQELPTSLQRVERVFDLSSAPGASITAARARMVGAESELAQGQAKEAHRAMLLALGSVSDEKLPDAHRITRDIVQLAQIEEGEANWPLAADHLRHAALRMDGEPASARERSETWRQLGELYLTHPIRESSLTDAADAEERAFNAVASVLEANDPEVLHDRIDLGMAELRNHNARAAKAELAAVEHDTRGLLQGELHDQLEALRNGIYPSTGAARPFSAGTAVPPVDLRHLPYHLAGAGE